MTAQKPEIREVQKFSRKLLTALVFCSVLSIFWVFSRPVDIHLTLEMATSTPSTAQLFYDVGSGFTEHDSVSAPISSSAVAPFRKLSFDLPDKIIYHLRFDPLTTEGQVAIRSIAIRDGNHVVYPIGLSSVRPLNQIAKSTRDGSSLRIATTPGGTDPGLTFDIPQPIRPDSLSKRLKIRTVEKINVFLVAAALFVLALRFTKWPRLSSALAALHKRTTRIAKRFSDTAFIEFDSLAMWTYFVCLFLFIIGSALDLNGSSEAMFSRSYGHGIEPHIWIGDARASRADEWGYVTPDILNQYFRADRFGVRDSVLGDHDISLTGNIPVRHLSTIFRPQFWSFFLLPLDYAYAVYWQAKAVILFAGVFTFLLWLTRSSGWALTGALWYFFSPFMQWTYSWPSALPEMIGLLCLVCVLIAYISVGRNAVALFACAIGLTVCAIDFALCAYLPHMIPLCWAGAAVLIAWLVSSRQQIFRREAGLLRTAAFALAFGVIAFVGWKTYTDLKVAIAAVARTVYPGQRVALPGGMPLWKFASNFLPWTQTEMHFPTALGNICEGSGFLWLAPVTLLCVRRLVLSRFQKVLLIALWACFLLLFAWMSMPFPLLLGHMMGLDRVPAERALPALGLVNVAIVMITMAGLLKNRQLLELPISGRDLMVFVSAFAAFVLIFRATNAHLTYFYSHADIITGALLAAALVALMLRGSQVAFAAALVFPQVLFFGTVNPVERGLPVFTKSALHEFVEHHPQLLDGKWLVFSDSPVRSGFLAAAGCEVYTGTRYLPDIDHFSLFAADGLDVHTFNRLGYLDAHPISAGGKPDFQLQETIIVSWKVSPTDKILRQIGIKYLAFDAKPSPAISAALQPISSEPIDGFWLFELPSGYLHSAGPATATHSPQS